jgi:hypothetical protein
MAAAASRLWTKGSTPDRNWICPIASPPSCYTHPAAPSAAWVIDRA